MTSLATVRRDPDFIPVKPSSRSKKSVEKVVEAIGGKVPHIRHDYIAKLTRELEESREELAITGCGLFHDIRLEIARKSLLDNFRVVAAC